jgi:hypothetical protein
MKTICNGRGNRKEEGRNQHAKEILGMDTTPTDLTEIRNTFLTFSDDLSATFFSLTMRNSLFHKKSELVSNISFYVRIYIFFTVDRTNLPNNSFTLLSCQLCIYLI